MKINKILMVVAACLFLLSFFSYRDSVRRAERFERGQKFLPQLNPDEIAQIRIEKDGESTHLRRQGDRMVVVSENGYPARNDAVNRFIRDVLDISLEKAVGKGEGLRQELGLEPGGEGALEVTFEDASEKAMVHFLVGNAQKEGGGSYVQRLDTEDGAIYLTSSQVYITTAADDFVDKEILDVPEAEVARILGPDFTVERQDEALKLAEVAAGKQENASKLGQLKSLLSGLRFTSHHLADEPEVAGLRFDASLDYELEDQTGYRLEVAERGDKHYLRMRGLQGVTEVLIGADDDEDTVREKSEIIARADELTDFDTFHGSWVYEITEVTADKIRLRKRDLVENA